MISKMNFNSRSFLPAALVISLTSCFATVSCTAQELNKLDYFYAGEAKIHNMYIVKNGQIAWSYSNPASKGEISDAVLLPGGDILFAHQFGISIVNKEKQITWNYDAPAGCEIHTVVPSGKDHIVFIVNGKKPKVVVMNLATSKEEREFPLQVKDTASVHGQFRHARLTSRGTLLVAHMDLGKIREYDENGKILLSLDMPRPWSAEPLKNGNMLVCSVADVLEIDRTGKTVWQADKKLLADNGFKSPQIAIRLDNGNVLVNNWFNQWNGPATTTNTSPQAIEITPANQVVASINAWKDPINLGPSTIIQPLTRVGDAQKLRFGSFK